MIKKYQNFINEEVGLRDITKFAKLHKTAEIYFHKAAQSPIRSQQPLADSQLQNEAKLALANTQQRKLNNGRNKFLSLFTTATYSGE